MEPPSSLNVHLQNQHLPNHVEEMILGFLRKKILDPSKLLHTITYPNTEFFGVFEPPFTCQQEKMKI